MLSEQGDVTIVKSPTTPDDRTRGVLNALDAAARRLMYRTQIKGRVKPQRAL